MVSTITAAQRWQRRATHRGDRAREAHVNAGVDHGLGHEKEIGWRGSNEPLGSK
jgi:hypothetical protein